MSCAGISKRYFLPRFVFPNTELFHTRDWNLAQWAIGNNVPTVFYHDGDLIREDFCEECARSPLLKLVVTDCPVQKENMLQRGMLPEKICVVPNGVNRIFFSRQSERAEERRKNIIQGETRYMAVYAGALAPWKGIDILVDAATKLPEVRFVIAGGSDDEVKSWKKGLVEKKIANVNFLGGIQHSDLVSLCQAADIVVYPHRSGGPATHTSPLKFFEYLASGTPIVASDIPALADFKDRSLALEVCEPDSVEALARCLSGALSKFPRKAEGYQRNIEFAKQFTWEKRMKKVFQFTNHNRG
jgi:glycosyltransferase involved in cell wall biosynthesis